MSTPPPSTSSSCSIQTTTQIDHLPGEVLRDILSRLALQPLITSRYVCRSWNRIYHNLIVDPAFVSRHSRANPNNPDSSFLLVCHKEKGFSKLYMVDDNDKRIGNSLKLPHSTFHETSGEISSCRGRGQVRTIGSANGLICLSLHPKYNSFLVYNPITREMMKLPNPKPKEQFCLNNLEDSDFTGFVFDEATETYRVVFTCFYNANADCTALFVHTLGSGVWRSNEAFASGNGLEFCNREAVFLNGAFHVTAIQRYRYPTYRRSIGVIDIDAETLKSFALPSPDSVEGTLRLVKGCIGWIEIEPDGGNGIVWIMKNYGVAESWSKEYIIATEEFRPFDTLSLANLNKNGVFIGRRQPLGFIHLDKKERGYYYVDKEEPSHVHQNEDLYIQGHQVDVCVHAGSLVSPLRAFSTREMVGNAIAMDPHNVDLSAYDEEEDIGLESLFLEVEVDTQGGWAIFQ